MQSYDVIRQKRRFEMFSKKTKEKVLELNSFFGKYNMRFEDKIKKTFTYYDTPNDDLQKSHIVLFKTQIGNFVELNMATERVNTTQRYAIRSNYKHFKKQIRPTDSIFRHKSFLIDSFKGMFLSSVNFDPEFLLQKLEAVYVINTVSEEYKSFNLTGLKITYSFDKDTYLNKRNKQKATNNVLTIYQHTSPNSNEDFEDLISKLTRYLKELTPTSETKIMIARRMTNRSITDKKNKKPEEQNAKNQTKPEQK